MEQLRLEVRHRSLMLDKREFIFITQEGRQVERTDTEGVVQRVQRYVNRRLRGHARVHGRAQVLQSLRQFNSPREGYAQFVVVETERVDQLAGLGGSARDRALDQIVVYAIQARLPVDLQAMERWVREQGQWIGLSGKNQVLGGKARLATEGIVSDFEPEKLLARSLLDKPEAFRGPTLRILVVDDPFVDAVTGDGAFLVRAGAYRQCERTVTQRIRRCLTPEIRSAKRGQVYVRLEFEDKVARYDTEILSVVEDGDLLHVTKRESARIDTGAKLVHERGFKGTAIVVDQLPAHIEMEWPGLDGVCNSSCIKSNALLAGFSQQALWGNFQTAYLLDLPVRMLFTGYERVSRRGNRVSLNVLSTLHSVSPQALDRVIGARSDESPGPIINALLWWADHMEAIPEAARTLPTHSKADLRSAWGDDFERRFAFGDQVDHPVLDPQWNPEGFVACGRGGNRILVPSARALLATLGRVEVDGEPGFFFPDYLNGLLQVFRCLDVKPERFEETRKQLHEAVVRAANAMLEAHSIRVPGLHGVLVAAKGLGDRVVVPNEFDPFLGTIHGEPTMNRDGIRSARVQPLTLARRDGANGPEAAYLLEHCVPEEFAIVLADFDRLTRMNRDNDGDLIYVSRLQVGETEAQAMDQAADAAPGFVDPQERMQDIASSFRKLRADHDPYTLSAEAVHKAVLETAGSARDVGSITLWKYCVQEALAEAHAWDLMATVARIVQAYIDGLKGPHQQSANLFAGLMRVWARMAVPCVAVKDERDVPRAVRLSPSLNRELLRAGYEDGRDFVSQVEVPHPALLDEAFRRIKRPLVAILEEILVNLESQGLATRKEMVRLRDILEDQYGVYPTHQVENRAGLVAERRATYTAVRRLYGIQPVGSVKDVEEVGVRPVWKRLMALSTDPGEGRATLDRLAEQAVSHAAASDRVEF